MVCIRYELTRWNDHRENPIDVLFTYSTSTIIKWENSERVANGKRYDTYEYRNTREKISRPNTHTRQCEANDITDTCIYRILSHSLLSCVPKHRFYPLTICIRLACVFLLLLFVDWLDAVGKSLTCNVFRFFFVCAQFLVYPSFASYTHATYNRTTNTHSEWRE